MTKNSHLSGMAVAILVVAVATVAMLSLVRCSSPDSFAVHTNNWAVIACTSSYWFNYRHVSNALSVYYIVRRMGIPDSQIILMNSMDPSCDARNPYPGELYSTREMERSLNKLLKFDFNKSHHSDIGVEVDYRGDEVSVDSFLRVLTGRHRTGTEPSKILQSGNNSNVLIFLSGHGGDAFFKFRDSEELSAEEIGYALKEMELKGRYREMLLIADTCQASTLADKVTSSRVITIGSSGKGENSYSHENVPDLGISVMDRFSFLVGSFFYHRAGIVSGNIHHGKSRDGISKRELRSRRQNLASLTLQDLLDSMNPQFMRSTVSVALSDNARDPKDVLLSDFFGQSTRGFKTWEAIHVPRDGDRAVLSERSCVSQYTLHEFGSFDFSSDAEQASSTDEEYVVTEIECAAEYRVPVPLPSDQVPETNTRYFLILILFSIAALTALTFFLDSCN
jgi:glycosylphosphatidylinositol transamidase (GPIT) subunit GPI8